MQKGKVGALVGSTGKTDETDGTAVQAPIKIEKVCRIPYLLLISELVRYQHFAAFQS